MVVAGTMLVHRSRPGTSLVCTHPHVLVVFVKCDDRDGRLLYATQDLTLLVLDRSTLGQLFFEEHVALESLSLFPADEFGDALVDTTRIRQRGSDEGVIVRAHLVSLVADILLRPPRRQLHVTRSWPSTPWRLTLRLP